MAQEWDQYSGSHRRSVDAQQPSIDRLRQLRCDEIVVYGGWGDTGRDENGFQVSYSGVNSPGTFVPLTSPQTTFDFLPGGAGVPNATRQTVTPSAAARLAANVAAVKITFNSEEN